MNTYSYCHLLAKKSKVGKERPFSLLPAVVRKRADNAPTFSMSEKVSPGGRPTGRQVKTGASHTLFTRADKKGCSSYICPGGGPTKADIGLTSLEHEFPSIQMCNHARGRCPSRFRGRGPHAHATLQGVKNTCMPICHICLPG